MKKIAFFTLLFAGLFIAERTQAQKSASFRQQKPEETAFMNMLHQQLFDALPHTYKNWATAKEDLNFDATKYWCRDPGSWSICNGFILKTIGINDAWTMDWQVDFTMPDEEMGPLVSGVVSSIKDFTNAPQVAAAIKSAAKSKLSIFIVANLYITGTNSSTALTYCSKTPPVPLSIPVPTTLALKGLRSAECPIMDGGSVSLHGNYYDDAIVFLGKPVVAKKTENTSDGLNTTRYEIAFDRTKIGRLAVQNVVITFKGDSADIDEAIKLINWQKLSDLIAK
ncbi:hypothetical protein [Mucilaginibacter sp.]|uniref:hypothetical protein n=1 Tax=Mucilaginibacter sp. TaxID=1882438 RepID=UPI0025DB2D68|nr:hypothetical protein [Mucilaginibacter sp.]